MWCLHLQWCVRVSTWWSLQDYNDEEEVRSFCAGSCPDTITEYFEDCPGVSDYMYIADYFVEGKYVKLLTSFWPIIHVCVHACALPSFISCDWELCHVVLTLYQVSYHELFLLDQAHNFMWLGVVLTLYHIIMHVAWIIDPGSYADPLPCSAGTRPLPSSYHAGSCADPLPSFTWLDCDHVYV